MAPSPHHHPHDPRHTPVMLREVMAAFAPRVQDHPEAPLVYVDATAGLGGHARAVARTLPPGSIIVLNDVDPDNLAAASAAVRADAPGVQVVSIRANFAHLPHEVRSRRLRADLLLADVGVASTHLDEAGRGFSFSRDGPLDMRMDPTLPMSALELVRSASEAELARIIEQFGEDRAARRIARKLVEARQAKPILRTSELAHVVRNATGPAPEGGIDPATRTFQALRIAVNDELGVLEALAVAIAAQAGAPRDDQRWMAPGAVAVVVSFHSLEDRIVKRAFAEACKAGATNLSSGVQVPSEEEMEGNPRARSAKLRALRLPK